MIITDPAELANRTLAAVPNRDAALAPRVVHSYNATVKCIVGRVWTSCDPENPTHNRLTSDSTAVWWTVVDLTDDHLVEIPTYVGVNLTWGPNHGWSGASQQVRFCVSTEEYDSKDRDGWNNGFCPGITEAQMAEGSLSVGFNLFYPAPTWEKASRYAIGLEPAGSTIMMDWWFNVEVWAYPGLYLGPPE